MKTFTHTIDNEEGIHSRPAGLLVKAANQYKSEIILSNGDRRADAKKIFAVMSLGARRGNTVRVDVSGEDEEAAAAALRELFQRNF